MSSRKGSYVVIPHGEYDSFYNKQYLELTSLKKKVDPNDKRERYLETTLKMHYPKVYNNMIRNDYILINSTRTQEYLDALPKGDYEMKKQANLHRHKQLAEVTSGRQSKRPLLNPMRFLTEDYINSTANESTLSPEKC